MLGSSSQFKAATITRVHDRLVAGVQGMVTSLPPHYSIRFGLMGSADGITAGMMAYGATLRMAHGTRDTKLTLEDDPLSRAPHYTNDGGSLLNYCDYWVRGRLT